LGSFRGIKTVVRRVCAVNPGGGGHLEKTMCPVEASVLRLAPLPYYLARTNTAQTGTGTSKVCPVGESLPELASMRNTTTVSEL